MVLKRCGLTLIALLLATSALAQSQTGPTGPFAVNQGASNVSDPWYVRFVSAQHFICDSGCGGGTTDTDDGSIAGGQTVGLVGGLTYYWTGAAWARFAPSFTGSSLDINCTGGCGGPASFADNAAFTFGTTSIGVTGYVVDDAAVNAVTENSAGTPRMSTNRVAYGILRDAAGNERGANVNASNQLTVEANAGTNLNTSALLTTAAHDAAFGTAGTADAQVRSVQGIASMTPLQVQSNSANLATQTTAAAIQTAVETIDNIVSGAGANISQFGGTNVVTGIGGAAAGVPRVTVSDDNTEATGTVSGTGSFTVALAGRQGVGFYITAACTCTFLYEYSWDNGTTYAAAIVSIAAVQNLTGSVNPAAAIDGNAIVGEHWTHFRVRVSAYTSGSPVVWVHATKLVSPLAVGALNVGLNGGASATFFTGQMGGIVRTAVPTAETALDLLSTTVDPYGHLFVRQDNLNRIRCTVTVSTATTITAVGGSCAAPGANLSLYITGVHASSSAAAGTAADSMPTLKYGTGGTCGTGTTVWWLSLQAANTTTIEPFATPIKIPANNEICWIMSTAGTKAWVITGFIAP